MDNHRQYMNHRATQEVIEWWNNCDSKRKFQIKLIFPSFVGKLKHLCEIYQGPVYYYKINFRIFLENGAYEHVEFLVETWEELEQSMNKAWENSYRLNLVPGYSNSSKKFNVEAIWFEPVEITSEN